MKENDVFKVKEILNINKDFLFKIYNDK